MQATWGRVVPSGKAPLQPCRSHSRVLITIHKYSEDRRVRFLPGQEGSEQTRKGKKTGVNAVMLGVM